LEHQAAKRSVKNSTRKRKREKFEKRSTKPDGVTFRKKKCSKRCETVTEKQRWACKNTEGGTLDARGGPPQTQVGWTQDKVRKNSKGERRRVGQRVVIRQAKTLVSIGRTHSRKKEKKARGEKRRESTKTVEFKRPGGGDASRMNDTDQLHAAFCRGQDGRGNKKKRSKQKMRTRKGGGARD